MPCEQRSSIDLLNKPASVRCCLTDVPHFWLEGSDRNSTAVPGLSAQALTHPRAAVGADQCLAGEQVRLCFNLTTRWWSAPRPEPLQRNGKYMNVVIILCTHTSACHFVSGHSFCLSLTFKSEEPWNYKTSTFTKKISHHIFRVKCVCEASKLLQKYLQMKILTWTSEAQTRLNSRQILLICFDFIGKIIFF